MKILIIYQHRTREYDNALLLKAYLEEQGNLVDIKHDASEVLLFRRYDYYILPCLYNNAQFDFLTCRFNIYNKPMLNLRYEQVCTGYDYESGSMVPTQRAMDIPATCWGDLDKECCVKHGMLPEAIYVTGHLTMDFLRPEFDSYWMTKELVAEKENIAPDRKWILFISTLSYADDEECLKKGLEFFGEKHELREVAELQSKTRKILLEWFSRIMTEQDICLIYRPHPSEKSDCDDLNGLKNLFPDRFFVCSEYNIKQWIKVSDVITSWMSTSIVECFFAKKTCFILRPESVDIPAGWDAIMYENCDCIADYDTFYHSVLREAAEDEKFYFPISDSKILKNYDNTEIPTYKKIAEIIKKTNRIRNIGISYSQWKRYKWKYLFANHVILKVLFKRVYGFLFNTFHIKITDRVLRGKYAIELWEKEFSHRQEYKLENLNKYKKIKSILKEDET